LHLHRYAVRFHRGLRARLLDVDRPLRAEVSRLDVTVNRHVRRDDVLPRNLDERLHPRALEAFALEGVLVHHALLERAVQCAERIEDVVPEILPALVDRLAETLGHDPQEVLRLLLVLPFLDLLAALVFVDPNPAFSPEDSVLWVWVHFVHLHVLELLRPDPGPLMVFVALAPAEPQLYPFRRFLAALGLRTWEPAISGGHAPKPPLPRPELGPRTVLDPLHFELPVLVAERTITADTLRHLHGGRPGAVTEKTLY